MKIWSTIFLKKSGLTNTNVNKMFTYIVEDYMKRKHIDFTQDIPNEKSEDNVSVSENQRI